ncbi:MAG TPA: hypothetical protein VHR88_02685 [Solirubrobacteraceae bacterium]|nr:hypothetical protein [Solirubrobacteraceae bacterium]
MAKVLGVVVVSALLVLPSAALARGKGTRTGVAARAAVQQCNQERSQIGKPAFRQKYGKPRAFARCVVQHLAADRAAARDCRGERKSMGVQGFRQKYGTPNALMRCIRAKAG